MKKVFFLILGCLLLLNVNLFANRATNAGSFIVGGEISYTIETYEYDWGWGEVKGSRNTLIISPEIYWFAIDNLAFGGIVDIYKYKDTEENEYGDDESKYTSLFLNPGIKYFFDINPSMSINASVSYGITFFSYGDESLEKEDFSTLTFGSGLDYFITSHIAVEPYILYRKGIYGGDYPDDYKNNIFDFGCKLAIFLF